MIAVLATALAFAMSLLMSWVNARLHNEPGNILKVLGADAWVVESGRSGPFTASRVIPARTAEQVAALPGVTNRRTRRAPAFHRAGGLRAEEVRP
jgi:putative ABC transport system permease protein